jgi:hypoxanthine phosphoribosyltransferase
MDTIQIHDKQFEEYISGERIDCAIDKIALKIELEYTDKKPIFLGVLNGSFMFFSDLIKKIHFPCEVAFTRIKTYEGETSTEKLKVFNGIDDSIQGKHVIIVEDIIDTGFTLSKLLDALSHHRPASVKVATLIFKPEAYKGKHPIDYYGIEIPNHFIVGYGLDYHEEGRNLNAIYKLSIN